MSISASGICTNFRFYTCLIGLFGENRATIWAC